MLRLRLRGGGSDGDDHTMSESDGSIGDSSVPSDADAAHEQLEEELWAELAGLEAAAQEAAAEEAQRQAESNAAAQRLRAEAEQVLAAGPPPAPTAAAPRWFAEKQGWCGAPCALGPCGLGGREGGKGAGSE